MLKVNTIEGQAIIETAVRLRSANIAPNLHVYRRAVTHKTVEYIGKVSVPSGSKQKGNISGFTDDKGLDSLIKKGVTPTQLPYFIMTAKVQEDYRTLGWVGASEKKENENWHKTDPFVALIDENVSLDQVVKWDSASHMLFDIEGQPLPVAVEIEYIMGGMDESRYDLVKAAEILLNRDDVHVYNFDAYGERGEGEATSIKEAIAPIPYYNADQGRSKTINARWMPSVKDYRRMWNRCLSYKDGYSSTKKHMAIFDEDLLGLRAGGAAYFDTFYGSKRY